MPVPFSSPNFPDTRWTIVAQLAVSGKEDVAMATLCKAYWGPVYAFLRRSGQNHEDAEDLTQSFFEMVMRQELFQRASKDAGRLRSFLLGSLEHFLANDRRFHARQKRGGGVAPLPLNEPAAISEMESLASKSVSPAEAFDRAWVTVLLQQVIQELRGQYQAIGRTDVFVAILPWLLEADTTSQAAAASQAGLSVANFRLQIHRLRKRYREALHREIAATLGSEDSVTEELQYLFSICGRPV